MNDMEDRSPERDAAMAQLSAALDAVGRAGVRDGASLNDSEVITTYAVVACVQDPGRPHLIRYLTIYPGRDTEPPHVPVGLFTVALDQLTGGWTYVDDEDEE